MTLTKTEERALRLALLERDGLRAERERLDARFDAVLPRLDTLLNKKWAGVPVEDLSDEATFMECARDAYSYRTPATLMRQWISSFTPLVPEGIQGGVYSYASPLPYPTVMVGYEQKILPEDIAGLQRLAGLLVEKFTSLVDADTEPRFHDVIDAVGRIQMGVFDRRLSSDGGYTLYVHPTINSALLKPRYGPVVEDPLSTVLEYMTAYVYYPERPGESLDD